MQCKCNCCKIDTDSKDEAGICCQCDGVFCRGCCYYDKRTDQVWCFECSEAAIAAYANYEENEDAKYN